MAAKAGMSGFRAIKGNGVKIPAFNQYRGHRELCSSAKAGHWGNLRRQNTVSSEMRVGRTAVVDGIFAKNGYGDVRVIHTIAFYFSIIEYGISVAAGYARSILRLNKRMGCKSPRCRRCKCRDSLPLMKVSHWKFFREGRQAIV